MSKHAIVTCGFPRSGKTSHYHSNYSEYSYFNVDIPSKEQLQELQNLAQSAEKIYIEGRNPSKKNRMWCSQFFKDRGYSVSCLWFPMPFEAILSHSFDISNFQEKQQFLSEAYSFNNRFEIPDPKEPFTVLEKIPFKPEVTKYGENKALFLSVYGILAQRVMRTELFEPVEEFELIRSQFYKIIENYYKDGYKVILAPNKMVPWVLEENVVAMTRKIAKKAKIPFTDIVFDERAGSQLGTIRMAHPGGILKACEKHKIDLENSIMVGSERFEKALSMIAGCRYYFSGDVFFGVQNYVKMVLEGKKHETNY